MKASCGTCKWFQCAIGPTGRKRPTQPGTCTWRIPWPKVWPISMYCRFYFTPGPPLHPAPQQMWPHEGERCECYKDVEAAREEDAP